MTTRFTPQGLVHEHSDSCSHSLDEPFNAGPDEPGCASWGCCHGCEVCERYCGYDLWKQRLHKIRD